ncbi:hypothetical protein LZ30DRAFT_735882 [Colletotrichum cereale]|nr:hypothetical protein LZ30DRAFT_735882 [Colletotrichum cereale]
MGQEMPMPSIPSRAFDPIAPGSGSGTRIPPRSFWRFMQQRQTDRQAARPPRLISLDGLLCSHPPKTTMTKWWECASCKIAASEQFVRRAPSLYLWAASPGSLQNNQVRKFVASLSRLDLRSGQCCQDPSSRNSKTLLGAAQGYQSMSTVSNFGVEGGKPCLAGDNTPPITSAPATPSCKSVYNPITRHTTAPRPAVLGIPRRSRRSQTMMRPGCGTI